MKLLIADDSKVSRMMLSAITKEWGYQVVLAEDGEQAWQIMQQDDAPQLLLLDWEMPRMDGIEVCQRVIAKKNTSAVYIVLLSSRTTTDDIVEGLSKGANDYLSKPFDIVELEARLKVGKRMIIRENALNLKLQALA